MAIKKVFYRSPHNYDLDEASDEATVKDYGPSLTVQSMAEDVDINVLMKRFGVTGKLEPSAGPVFYGDFDGIVDYKSAHQAVIEARDRFNGLPADIRARFQNDPQQFLEFCEQPTNLEQLRTWGLAKPASPTSSTTTNAPQPPETPPEPKKA